MAKTTRRDAKAIVRLLHSLYRSPLMTLELSTEEAVREEVATDDLMAVSMAVAATVAVGSRE